MKMRIMIWEEVPEGEKLFSTATSFDTEGKGGSIHAMQYWIAQARKKIIEKRIEIIKGELTDANTEKPTDSE